MIRVRTPTGQEVIDLLEDADDQDVIEYDPREEEVNIVSDTDDDVVVIEEVIVLEEDVPLQNLRRQSPPRRSPNLVILEDEAPNRAVQNERRASPDLEILEDEEPNQAFQNGHRVQQEVEILEDEERNQAFQNGHRVYQELESSDDEDPNPVVQNEHLRANPDLPDMDILEDEEPHQNRASPLPEVIEDDDEQEEQDENQSPPRENLDPRRQRPATPQERNSPVPMILEDEEPHQAVQNRAHPPLEVIEDDDEQEDQDENQAPHQENSDPRRHRPVTPRNSPVPIEPQDATPKKPSPKRLRSRASLSEVRKENAPEQPRVLREPRALNFSVAKTPEQARQSKRSHRRTSQNVIAPAGMAPTPTSASRKRKATGSVKRERSKTKSPEDEEQEEEDGTEETDSERALRKRPVIVVIDKSLKSGNLIKNRVIRVKHYEFKIPKLCTEAVRGRRLGQWNRDKKLGTWPGVPNRKFSGQQDYQKYGQGDQDWPVQGVYEGDDPQKYKVLYEGWTNESINERPIDEVLATAPEHVHEMRLRNEFYLKMREIMVEHRNEFNDERMSNRRPDNIFWLYLELGYFHSMKNKEYGMSPIWYMHIMKSNVLPPRFAYTPLNILNAESYEFLRRRKENTHWNTLKDGMELCIGPKDYTGPCQNGKGCKCDARYTLLYGEANDFNGHRFSKNIIPRADGTIDVKQFNLADTRVIMECSNVCGCDSQCPRRQLQRGQQKPLVVFHESQSKGFGVRAAANFKSGEFICEYTGIARCNENLEFDRDEHAFVEATKQKTPPRRKPVPIGERAKGPKAQKAQKAAKKADPVEENVVVKPYVEEEEINKRVWGAEWKKRANDMSYEAGFNLMDTSMVISANSVGNIARFINHSCDSNTAFMEVFSRRYETDVLVPRIAVYAIRDIEIGEEVTTNYYANHKVKKSAINCCCGTKACTGFLPDVCL